MTKDSPLLGCAHHGFRMRCAHHNAVLVSHWLVPWIVHIEHAAPHGEVDGGDADHRHGTGNDTHPLEAVVGWDGCSNPTAGARK